MLTRALYLAIFVLAAAVAVSATVVAASGLAQTVEAYRMTELPSPEK